MHLQTRRSKAWLRIAAVLSASMAFALAYTQAPLYTSNQNQYFLHGLANAGFGFLESDWLANTADPTPVFSLFVEWTYRLNEWEGLFYLYYAILMCIYLFSLVGITAKFFPLVRTPGIYLTFLTGLILIHSAGLRFVLSRLIGMNWTYVLEDGVADQRLLGSVFQPSTCGVFLLLSIYLFLDRRAIWAGISAVAAATVHPTYLLSAATLIMSYMVLLFIEKKRMREPVLLGCITALLVLPILLYVFLNFGNTTPETAAAAQRILVDYRIPHHANISWWLDATAIFKVLVILTAMYLVRRGRWLFILLVPFGVGVLLTTAQVITGSQTLALLFPWRVSTWLMPISTSILFGWLVIHFYRRFFKPGTFYVKGLIFANLAMILLAISAGIFRTFLDFSRQSNLPDRAMMNWISENKTPEDRYLIPTKMQDFRLYTGAPIFVDFKSIPYRDVDVLEWHRRILLADIFYKREDCSLIQGFPEKEKINYLVLTEEEFNTICPHTMLVYSDAHYQVYRFEQ